MTETRPLPRPSGSAASRAAMRNRRAAAAVAGLVLGAVAGAAGAGLPGAAGGAVLAALAALPWMRLPRGVAVLTYHSVSPDASWLPWADRTSIRPESFADHCALFSAMGYTTMTLDALTRARIAGTPLPRRPLAITFDDGYRDNLLAWDALKAHGLCATLHVSTDFVAPAEEAVRPGWDGFLTWDQLRAMDASPEWRIEAHGTDHGRVAIGPAIGRLTPDNTDRTAWMHWAATPGPKHDWYRRPRPLPPGTPIPRSAPALAARAWDGASHETEAAYRARVAGVLARSRDVLAAELGRAPEIFCWPESRTTPQARDEAARAGFRATTAGRGRNAAAEPPSRIARLSIGQDYAGFRSAALDRLALRAHLRAFEGNLWWGIPLLAFAASRRVSRALPRGARPARPLKPEAAR